MSRRSVLISGPAEYVCELCGEKISHDVARIDGDRLYHLRCFSARLHEGAPGLHECPACRTLGALWSWDHAIWNECDVCSGTGYLAGRRPARAAKKGDAETLAAG